MILFPFRSNLARALAGAGRFEEAIAELDAVGAGPGRHERRGGVEGRDFEQDAA